MRTYTEEEPTFLYPGTLFSPFFLPHKQKDKWDNEVSEIMFPSYAFRMVHQLDKKNGQTAYRQSATIYGGKDQFVKFNSFWSDSDTQAHTVEIKTALGDFYTWWGDGEGGHIGNDDLPSMLKRTDPGVEELRTANKRSEFGDNEVLFILYVMNVIHLNEHGWWFSKATWEPVKQQLIANRHKRR